MYFKGLKIQVFARKNQGSGSAEDDTFVPHSEVVCKVR